MLLKRILAASLLLYLVPLALLAQTSSESGITVVSTPTGAEVVLEGEARVVGVTPTVFHQPLVGEYKVKIKKYGFETYTSKIILDPSRSNQLTVELTPKTRFKAGVRSLIIPGWGQYYTEQKTKAFLFSFLTLGSVAAYLIADNDFDKKNEGFNNKLNEYDHAVASGASYQELQRLSGQLNEAQQDAYDAENIRRITIGSVIGIWGLNLLDALVFFPQEKGEFTVKGLTVTPVTDMKSQTFGLKLSHSF